MSFSSRTRHIALIAGSAITASCALAQGTSGLWSRGFLHTPDAATTLTASGPGRVLASSSGGGITLATSVQWPFKLGGIVTCDTSNLDTPAPGLPQRSITSTFHDGSTEVGRVVCHGKHFTGRPPLLGNRSIACDFSSSGAIAVEWRCIDESGIVLAQGVSSGPFLSCDDLSDYPAGDSSSYSMGAGKATFKEFTVTKRTGSARVYSTTGPVLVPDVTTISFRPIWCITSPCPGDGLSISDVAITTDNLAQLEISDAELSWSWGASNSTTSYAANRITIHGNEGTKIVELPPEDLNDDGQLDNVIGAGSVAGITGGAVAGIVIARPTASQSPASFGIGYHAKNYVGHVTLIKQRTASGLITSNATFIDPLTGQYSLTPDYSAINSPEFELRDFDALGQLQNVIFSSDPVPLFIPNQCPPPGAWVVTWKWFPCDGWVSYRRCITSGTPGGNGDNSTLRVAPATNGPLLTDISQIEIVDRAPLAPDGIEAPIQLGLIEIVTAQPFACDSIDFNGNGVFPEDQDVVDFFDVLAGGTCPTGLCNDIDFNNNDVFPEDQDVVDFFNVLAGGACP